VDCVARANGQSVKVEHMISSGTVQSVNRVIMLHKWHVSVPRNSIESVHWRVGAPEAYSGGVRHRCARPSCKEQSRRPGCTGHGECRIILLGAEE